MPECPLKDTPGSGSSGSLCGRALGDETQGGKRITLLYLFNSVPCQSVNSLIRTETWSWPHDGIQEWKHLGCQRGQGFRGHLVQLSLHTMRRLRHPGSTFLKDAKYVIWEALSSSTCMQMKLSDSNEVPGKRYRCQGGPGKESPRGLHGILGRWKVAESGRNLIVGLI